MKLKLLVWCVAAFSIAYGPRLADARAPFAPGEVLVIPNPTSGDVRLSDAGRPLAASPAAAAALARHGLTSAEALSPPRAGAAPRHLRLRSDRADFDPVAAARDLVASGAARAAAPNYRVKLHVLPNDTYIPYQWAIQEIGDDDIDLPEAWDVEKGSAATLIAVMDTGVDLGHPDLAAKIWTNAAEIPGNGMDDDSNGYVDDRHGWDFGDGDADPNPEPFFDEATGIDVGFHGTFVAAIAAASTDNATGIAGAGWNCRIVPLKVADSAGGTSLAAVAAAFAYATDLGVEVLNMSLGAAADPGVPEFFQALVDDATAAGVLCVASAGNDGTSALNYPAACAHVLSVAATDAAGDRASFSNWGPTVDVAAPGAEIWSAICRNYEIDEFSQVFYLYLWLWDGENPYMYGDGTSFAAPLVAGVAGLVRSRYPALGPDQVASQVALTGDVVTYDHAIGRKVNAYAAVTTALAAEAAPPPGSLALAIAGPNPTASGTTFTIALSERAEVRLTLFDQSGRRVRDVTSGERAAGRHVVAWDGLDAGGRVLPAGVYFAALDSGDRRAMQRLVVLK
jgi:subtilisin family serine protease